MLVHPAACRASQDDQAETAVLLSVDGHIYPANTRGICVTRCVGHIYPDGAREPRDKHAIDGHDAETGDEVVTCCVRHIYPDGTLERRDKHRRTRRRNRR